MPVSTPTLCHCETPVAAATNPREYAALGPAAETLCERCLPVRCDAHPGACESQPSPFLAVRDHHGRFAQGGHIPPPPRGPSGARPHFIVLDDGAVLANLPGVYRVPPPTRRERVTTALREALPTLTYYAALVFLLALPGWTDAHKPLRDVGPHGVGGVAIMVGILAAVGVFVWHAPDTRRRHR